MWPNLIAKAKEGGLDVIQTYMFWNLHEPRQDQYDFSGRCDMIENEYGNVEEAFHEKGLSYIRWVAQMAVGLQTGVPWCRTTFKGPNSPNKPSLWTENWTSFYQVFDEVPYLRSAQDIVYNVALFIAKMGYHFAFKGTQTGGFVYRAMLLLHNGSRMPNWVTGQLFKRAMLLPKTKPIGP
ncbi:hypothetical protein VNO77_03059 [Canavalia gladiata]|uniref:beta-galactosidase n=1 Tax=Canavalia gladiata TaxID=3824 RepID=A0AAN9MU73_CANGL